MLEHPNSALWWMLSHAAEVSQDERLKSLVTRHEHQLYGSGDAVSLPWRRLINTQARVSIDLMPIDSLVEMLPYQKDFLHAALCSPVRTPDQSVTGDFLQQNLCTPNLLHVVTRDKVCATHQLMALQVHRQSRCQGPQPSDLLRAELLESVKAQLFWFPWFEDADIQRVLMVYWQQGPEAVRPAWFNRALAAQRADGGWAGERQIIGLPEWLQPYQVKRFVMWVKGHEVRPLESDFHASAQGVLLLALSLDSRHQGIWALSED